MRRRKYPKLFFPKRGKELFSPTGRAWIFQAWLELSPGKHESIRVGVRRHISDVGEPERWATCVWNAAHGWRPRTNHRTRRAAERACSRLYRKEILE
jgi:transposase